MMIEIVVAPPVGSGIALGILDRHICAVEWAREIAAPRRLDARTVVVLLRQRELQLLEQDGPFGKLVRLLVDRVGAWLDVDVVIFREAGARLGRVRVKRFGASLEPLSGIGVSGDPRYTHSWKSFGSTRSPEAVYCGS